jgi:hypothetical protein
MAKWTRTGQQVAVLSSQGLGVTCEVLQCPDRLNTLAKLAAESARGYVSRGAIKVQLTPQSRDFLRRQRETRGSGATATAAPSPGAPAVPPDDLSAADAAGKIL